LLLIRPRAKGRPTLRLLTYANLHLRGPLFSVYTSCNSQKWWSPTH